jgi:Ca-activated chloride channel family protein
MQRAAEIGKGTFTYIGKQSEVKQQVTRLFKQIAHPVVSDVQLAFSDGTVPEYWPSTIPDLYLGQPLMLSLKLPSGEHPQLVVSGNIGGQFWQRSLNLQTKQPAAGLDLLWARHYIAALELSNRYLYEERIEKQVLALALKYHLVSSQTSLVAVDVTPARPANLPMVNKQIDGGMPHGWQQPAVLPQTSTASRLLMLLGAMLLALAGLSFTLRPRASQGKVSI